MGPNHMVADVRGVAAGCQGCGFGPVCGCQLVYRLHAHARLHTYGGQDRPVGALPVFYGGVCVVSAVQRRVYPRDPRPLAGGNRELFQDRTNVHHQPQSSHCRVELRPKDPFDQRVGSSHSVPLKQRCCKGIFEFNM